MVAVIVSPNTLTPVWSEFSPCISDKIGANVNVESGLISKHLFNHQYDFPKIACNPKSLPSSISFLIFSVTVF